MSGVKARVSDEEWQARVALAAACRLVAMCGWADLGDRNFPMLPNLDRSNPGYADRAARGCGAMAGRGSAVLPASRNCTHHLAVCSR